MDAMQLNAFPTAREQVADRRQKLEAAIATLGPRPELTGLLAEVDAALERLALGTYGSCDVCHDPIEPDRLLSDPVVRVCLGCLSPSEQRALEHDLQLAARIQQGLLPNPSAAPRTWDVAYHYEAARVVSGDYCDIIPIDGDLYFMLGDVSGKGVAAATLMAQLHALIRALVPSGLPIEELVARASRLFCESTLPMHYATMVCGRATNLGETELCNAGHLPVFVSEASGVRTLRATGLPMGMFCDQHFAAERFTLSPGDGVLLVTDGVTDAESTDGEPFGLERIEAACSAWRDGAAAPMVSACLDGLRRHAGSRRVDDTTVLALRFNGVPT